MIEKIRTHFAGHIRTLETVAAELSPGIERCATLIIQALRDGKKILVMGNGGSAADAQHMAAEFVGRFLKNRKAAPAIALTTDSSILTAVGNDFGFDEIFRRQVEALAAPGDVVIGISTSGNSENVCRALELAAAMGCTCLALSGREGGRVAQLSDHCLTIPSDYTPFIQEAHLTIIHILCDLVEDSVFPG